MIVFLPEPGVIFSGDFRIELIEQGPGMDLSGDSGKVAIIVRHLQGGQITSAPYILPELLDKSKSQRIMAIISGILTDAMNLNRVAVISSGEIAVNISDGVHSPRDGWKTRKDQTGKFSYLTG